MDTNIQSNTTVENEAMSDFNDKLSSIRVEKLPNNQLLKVRNLRVDFKNGRNSLIRIVRGVDIDVNNGQIVGLVGESGSGKSVTSKALINVNENALVSSDELVISDIDLSKIKKQKLWESVRGHYIGYIPQDPLTSLNPTRKIGKQLLDALNLNSEWKWRSKEEKKAYLIGLLERFGIHDAEEVYDRYPHTLSGGMKQRVVITMVVALKPLLIIGWWAYYCFRSNCASLQF